MLTNIIVTAVTTVAAWIGAHFVGSPILAIRRARLDAISIGETYAFTLPPASRQDEADIKAAKRSLMGAAAALRTQQRGQSWVGRAFCRMCRYDLESAATALQYLAGMAGGPYDCTDSLDFLYLSLNSHKTHMTPGQVADLRRRIANLKNAWAEEFTRWRI
jgi:hypothetical protein